ncbi:MAG: helix-hairpin-helix domain-containing protein [Nitrospira sp.]|nr:helix-hairpin-helix domain-containing protein [Nitrospira sp.]
MRREWMAVMVVGAMLMSGCVTSSQYQEALTDADNAREELEKVRQQKSAMEQQIRTLKELNVKFSNEAIAARDELQRIEHGRDKERGTVEGRTKELEEKVKALSAQNRNVRQEYQDVKRHNDTLKSLVARYQKELKDRSRSASAVLTPPAAESPAQAPSVAPPDPASAPGSASMNINKVSASDLVLFLGLKQEEADRIVSNRPYRVKGELVAKNVVSKETFDLIKDRISISQ